MELGQCAGRSIVEHPDDCLALEDGERNVGDVRGNSALETFGGVGEAAAAQKARKVESGLVGDLDACESHLPAGS